MVRIQHASECNCGTCEGSYTPLRHGGMPVSGGWHCLCSCHDASRGSARAQAEEARVRRQEQARDRQKRKWQAEALREAAEAFETPWIASALYRMADELEKK